MDSRIKIFYGFESEGEKMRIKILKPAEKIRSVVVFFSLYITLMLFQTDYMRLGTISAATVIFLTMVSFFVGNNFLSGKLRLPVGGLSLFAFFCYSTIYSLASTGLPSYYLPYASQIILCILLFTVNLNEREQKNIRVTFVVASTVYAVLIIKSLYDNRVAGYYHTDVLIFNTKFDPNFIGIPLTAAMAFLLDSALRKEKVIQSVIMYMVIAFAIFFTASRGSYVAAIASNGLVFVMYILKEKISAKRKVLYMVLPAISILVAILLVKKLLPMEWQRMQNLGIDQGSGRLTLWKVALNDWWSNPILGNGLEYAYQTHGKAAHNTYLQVLSETGLIGTFLMCGFLLPMLRKAFKMNTALFCAMIGVLVQIAFLDALNSRCLWILLCWIAMLPSGRLKYEEKKDEEYSA